MRAVRFSEFGGAEVLGLEHCGEVGDEMRLVAAPVCAGSRPPTENDVRSNVNGLVVYAGLRIEEQERRVR